LASAGVYWVAANVLRLDLAQTQTVDFLWLSFAAAQAVLYSARARGPFWRKPYPGRWLLLATAFDLIVVSLLATLGWLMAPISLTLVAELLGLTVLFLVATDGLKALLNRLAPTPAHPAPASPREGVSR
jgi:H+-transporting ATPase